jgi:hypothetical protein
MNSEAANTNIFNRKESLYRNTEKYKQAIEEQVNILKENAGQISKVALVIGGTLTVTYLLVRLLSKKGKKKEKTYFQPSEQTPALTVPHFKEDSIVIRTIKGYIATFLIALAQQKLQEVIAHYKETHAERDFKEDRR